MKRYLFWLKMECKRAAAVLPGILLKAVVLVITIGMIAFCASKILQNQEDEKQIQIGIVAEDNALTDMLLMFIENMESVKKWCDLVPVSKEEGMELLKQGELLGLAVLPENVVEEIISGSNEPARLYLAEDLAPLGLVFDELASAAVRLLQLAQAQIYATYDLAAEWNISRAELSEMCDRINLLNLQIALSRESFFETEQLSVTGEDSFKTYYGGALLTLYLLFAGLFFGKYIKRSSLEQKILAKRMDIPKTAQLFGRILVTVGLLLVVLLLIIPLLILAHISGIVRITVSIQSICIMILVLFCVAAMLQFIYMISDNHRFAVLLVGMNGVIMSYLAGCFLPTPLLPQIVEKVSGFLPVYYIKYGVSMLFATREGMFWQTAMFLVLWMCLLFAGARLLMREHLLKESGDKIQAISTKRKRNRSNSMFVILAKRLLSKMSLWVTLGAVLIVSVIMVNAEKGSMTSVYAAVYTADSEYEKVLTDYEGMVKFVLCESEEEVKRNVIQGKAECGYVLQEDLQEMILSGDTQNCITVYKDADTTQARVVNEIIFERIFYEIMTDWYEGYIAGHEAFAHVAEENGKRWLRKEAAEFLQVSLTDGSTFGYERQYVATDTDAATGEGRSVYPTHIVAWLCVILCTLIGIWEALADRRKNKFPLNAEKAFVITVGQAFLCGMLVALLLYLLT